MNYIPLSKIKYSNSENYEKIYKERFESPSSEHLDFNISGNKAFFIINNELLLLVSQLYELNEKLNSITDDMEKINDSISNTIDKTVSDKLDYFVDNIEEIKEQVKIATITKEDIREMTRNKNRNWFNRLFDR